MSPASVGILPLVKPTRSLVALLAALSVATAGCAGGGTDEPRPVTASSSGPDEPAVPDPEPSSPVPPTEPAPSTPPTEPAPPPPPEVWDHGGATGATLIGRAAGRYVVAWEGRVAGVDRDGEIAWEHRSGGQSDDPPVVVGDVVLTVRDNPRDRSWPGTDHLEARDARTGQLLWEDDESFPTGLEGTIFTSACTGGQDTVIGDCTLSARDPRTGSTRWAVPTYASVMVEGVVGDAVVVVGHPDGANPHLQLRSLATGAAISAGLVNENFLTLESTGFLDVVLAGERPRCRNTLRALDLNGDRLWTRRFVHPRNRDINDCEDLFAESAWPGGPIVVRTYSGDDRVLDPATGRELVRAGRGAQVRLVAAGLAVVEDEDGLARAVRLGSGGTAWSLRADLPTVWADAGPVVLRSVVDYGGGDSRTDVVDRRTGKVLTSMPGGYVVSGNGWVVTSTDVGGYEPAHLRTFRVRGVRPAPPISELDRPE